MIRGLVQEQNIRLSEQQAAERHAAPLAAREHGDRRVAGRATEGIHRLFQPAVQVPGIVFVKRLLQPTLFGNQLIEIGVLIAKPRTDFVVLPKQFDDRLKRFLDHLAHGLAGVELRLLFQQAAGISL